jgi:transposase
MYVPLPVITEALDELEARMKRERDGQRRLRLHLLVLIRSGAVRERQQAAEHLAVHRNTIGRWLSAYETGGLEQMLEIKPSGPPPEQKTLAPAIWAALQEKLAEEDGGFSGYLEVQQWLAEEYALPVPYATVHKLVRYRLGAKLKRARPRHAKKA